MKSSKILSIGTQNPSLKVSQTDILKYVANHPHVSEKALVFYRRFLSDPGIQTRYFGMDHLGVPNFETGDEAIFRFQQVATQIGASAARKALIQAGIGAADVSALIVTTCTGYLCPGLTSYIAQAVGLSSDIYSLDLVGIGCAAAIPAIRAADTFLKSHSNKYALVVSVEISSAALSWGDDIDLILSNSIFADGAAAAVLGNQEEGAGFQIDSVQSLLWPEYRDELRFKNRDSRLSNVISRNVPELASEAVKLLHGKLSEETQKPFDFFAFHPGGRKVLDEIQGALNLKEEQTRQSREILRDYGNMSSPSVLYVLKKILEEERPEADQKVITFSFGAGFSAFAASLSFVGESIARVARAGESKSEASHEFNL